MTNTEFDKYIEPHRNYIRSYIYSKVKKNNSLAEDLTQRTLIKAFIYFKNHTLIKSSCEPLLFKIANHVIIDYYHKDKQLKNSILMSEFETDFDTENYFQQKDFSDTLVDNYISQDIINMCLEALKTKNFKLYKVFIDAIDDMKYGDIAEKQSIPENTVKTRVFRARKFIQDYLSEKNISVNNLTEI